MSSQLDPIVSNKLRHFAQRRFRLLVARGVSAGLIAFLLAMSVVAFMDWYWLLTEEARWGLSAAGYVLTLFVVWGTSLRQLTRVPAQEEIASQVEQEEPELREKLLSAVELATDTPHVVYDSPVFRGLLQGEVATMMGSIRVGEILPVRLVARWMICAAALVGVAAVLLTSSDARFRQLATRAILPGANIARVSRIQIEILEPTPHSLLLAEDETVGIVVSVSGGDVGTVIVETFSDEGDVQRHSMSDRDDHVFATNLHIHESFDYRILAGDAITQRYRIDSRSRPHVTAFQKTFDYPDYAQLEPKTISETHGDVSALEGTLVTMRLTLDQEVSEAEFQLEIGDDEERVRIPLTSMEDQCWSAAIPIEKAGVYKVHLVAKETGFENVFSPKYAIDPRPDLIPRAGFVDQTASTLLLPPNDLVDLKAMAEDDLPVVSLDQLISVNGQEWDTIALDIEPSAHDGLQVSSAWQWDLLNLQLKTGDEVLTKLVATDRKGNQGESIPLRILIASPDFDAQRHQITQQKLRFYDELAAFEKQLAEQEETAHQVIAQMVQPERSQEQQATDRIALVDLARKQRDEAKRLVDKLRDMIRAMPPGADSYDLELTANVLAKMELESANSSIAFLTMMQQSNNAKAFEQELERLKRSYTRSADDAKHLAAQYQILSTHNFLAALAQDFAALLKQQTYVVESPSQSWERLLRQETVVINQLQQVEDFIADQQSRVANSVDRSMVSLMDWCTTNRLRLEEHTESKDQLNALRQCAGDVLNELKQKQRMDVLDGGLPRRIVNARKELINRAGSLYAPIEQLAIAVQQESRFLVLAGDSKDTKEGRSYLEEMVRYAADIDLKCRPSVNQLRARRELTQSRSDADAQYAADAGLTFRAVNWLMDQHRSETIEGSRRIDECLFEVAPAYRTLEAGHQLVLVSHALSLLLNLERWESQSLQGRTDHPRQWDLIDEAFQLTRLRLREAGVEQAIVSQIDAVRWSDAAKEVARRISQRRSNRDTSVTAARELREMCDAMKVVMHTMQPVMQQARAVIAQYAPSIPDLAHQAAEHVRALEDATLASADGAERSSQEEQQQHLADLTQQQEEVNQDIEDLFDALVEDANVQDILDNKQRQRAQDADRSIEAVGELAAKMNQDLADAQKIDDAKQQSQELSEAAEQQEKTAQALDVVAEHFSRLDEGLDAEETRTQLANMEQTPQRLANRDDLKMDEQRKNAEDLAAIANQDTSEALAALEEELQRNPAMQQALSEISQNALADAKNALNLAAEEDHRLQQDNERSDNDYREKKKELADALSTMAAEASQLANTVVEQARQMSDRGKTTEAQKRLDESKQKLNEAASQAKTAREEQLLSDLVNNAVNTHAVLQEAMDALKQAKDQTQSGKDENIHPDDNAKSAAKQDAEAQAKQFRDQQKRQAETQSRQADAAQRRADQNVKNAENQLRNIDRQIQQIENTLKKNPESNGLQQTLARKHQQQAAAQEKLSEGQEAQQAAADAARAVRQERDRLNQSSIPPLNAANPATELADRYTDEAMQAAQSLERKADELAQAIDFDKALTPTQNQLAQSETKQGRIVEDVQQAADDVARAARHETRLNNPSVAQPLQQQADRIEEVANQEVTHAEQQLGEAVSEAEENVQNPQQSQNVEALQAQTALASAETALAEQADRVGEQVAALMAAAEDGQLSSENGMADASTASGESQGMSEQPATNGQQGDQPLTSAEVDRGRQLAQALDELDRQMVKPTHDPPRSLDSLAQAAQAQQATMAAMRAESQQAAVESLSDTGVNSNGVPAGTGAAQDFNVMFVPRQEDKDWGKLRESSAKDATVGSSQAIAEEYRKNVEAYFKVLAERARK